MRYLRISFAKMGIDCPHLSEPWIGRAIGKQFDCCVRGHGIERIRINRDGFISFCGRCIRIIVLKSEPCYQFVGSGDFRIEFDCFCQIGCGLAIETIGGDARESEICLSIAGIFLKCFMKEIYRIGLVEALVH